MIKIALIGLSGVGKDSLIPDKPNIFNLKLSRIIKSISSSLFNLTREETELFKDNKLDIFSNNKTLRCFYKDLGTLVKEYRKTTFPEVFIREDLKKTYDYIESDECPYTSGIIVVSDLRFKYEMDLLRQEGFLFVYVSRKNHLYFINSIVNFLGVNLLSRCLIWLINPKYSHISEWESLQLKPYCDFHICLPLNKKDNYSCFQALIKNIESINLSLL